MFPFVCGAKHHWQSSASQEDLNCGSLDWSHMQSFHSATRRWRLIHGNGADFLPRHRRRYGMEQLPHGRTPQRLLLGPTTRFVRNHDELQINRAGRNNKQMHNSITLALAYIKSDIRSDASSAICCQLALDRTAAHTAQDDSTPKAKPSQSPGTPQSMTKPASAANGRPTT